MITPLARVTHASAAGPVWQCAAQAAGAEVLPGIDESGGTLPAVSTDPFTLPGVSVGPIGTPPTTIPGETVPGSTTIPAEQQGSLSEAGGAGVCAAITDPNGSGNVLPSLTGALCEQLYADITGGSVSRVTQGGTSCTPMIGVPGTNTPALAATIVAGYFSLPGPGALAPGGGIYNGTYEVTIWVDLQSNGAPVPTAAACTNGVACSNSNMNVID